MILPPGSCSGIRMRVERLAGQDEDHPAPATRRGTVETSRAERSFARADQGARSVLSKSSRWSVWAATSVFVPLASLVSGYRAAISREE